MLDALKKMINKTNLSSQSTQFKYQMCKKGLILEKIKYLNEFQSIVLHLDAAVNLVTIIQSLKNFTAEPENDIILSNYEPCHFLILFYKLSLFYQEIFVGIS